MLKFIVISDLHIVPEGNLSHAIDTTARLRATVDWINTEHADAAFVVLAGDLADHGEPDAYTRMKAETDRFAIPAYMTLGNHDDRANFLVAFPETEAAPTGYIDAVIALEEYRIVVLDTLLQGETKGHLDPAQITWLEAQLDASKGHPVIVVLHHNICDFGIPTDFTRLENSEEMLAALNAHGDVRQVISGHVHMSTAGYAAGVPFTTIGGATYSIAPRLRGPLNDVPRREGPGQIGVVIANEDRVVVHQENVVDRNAVMPKELFWWEGGTS
ncbi:MAG: metallophosphoesterase [Pseudomonadota bacterium]